MKKSLIALALIVFAFGLPMLSWSGPNSSFISSPIQSNPQMGQGERYVGNTDVQIVAPLPSNAKIEGEKAAGLPTEQLPEGKGLPDKQPFVVQPSKPQQ